MSGKYLTFGQRVRLEQHRAWRRKCVKEHRLHTLFWECTLRCNLSCRHCGSDCHVASDVPELSAEHFLSVIDTLTPHVDPHKVLIIMTGGEALTRQDIEHVGRELYRREYPWGIVTNGMLLDEKRLDSLLRAGIHTLTISLDGFEEAHNYLRVHPQSYARAERATRLLAAVDDVRWDIVTCANPLNLPTLRDFKEHLISIGVKAWRIFTIFPVGRAAEDPKLQLDDDGFTRLMEFIKETREEGRIEVSYGCEGFLGGYEGKVRPGYYTCSAGVGVASVLCDGTISACPSIRFDYKQGSIHTDDFWDVWQNRFGQYRDRSWARRGRCADCDMWRYCEGNGMHLHNDNGDLLLCHYDSLR